MGIFNREKYILWNIEEKEIVWEGKALLSKESVQQDIEDENLEDTLYRMEIWSGARKIRNAWVMRKPRKKSSPEELAEKSREEAEAYIQQSAKDIKKAVEDHQAFVAKVKQTYGIESGGGVGNIDVPTGKDGKLTIMGAANQAIAESTYLGIRETKPAEVAEAVKSVMNSGTTILAGIAQMLTERIVDSKKRPAKKKELEKKKEEPKPEPKKEEVKKEEVKTHKEDLGKGKTKVTFGSDGSTDPVYLHQKIDTTYNDSKTPVELDVYEEYERYMRGISKEEEVEEPLSE